MKNQVIIRKATIEDAEQLIAHTRKVLTENPDVMGTSLEEFTITVEEEREWIRGHEEHGLLLVAEMEQNIIGMLNFRLSRKKKFSHQGMIGMSIQEQYTNQGIGKTLLLHLFEWAEENPEVEKVSLEVFSNNERAIHLYKKLGFKEEGRRVNQAKLAPDVYVDDIIMTRFV